MSDKPEQILSQMQALWQGALGQVGHRAGVIVREVSARLEHEKHRPEHGWLDRALKTSARIADGRVVPLPSRIKKSLGRLHDAIDMRVTAQTPAPRATSSRGQRRAPVQVEAKTPQTQSEDEVLGQDGKTQQTRTPRKRRIRRREKTVDF